MFMIDRVDALLAEAGLPSTDKLHHPIGNLCQSKLASGVAALERKLKLPGIDTVGRRWKTNGEQRLDLMTVGERIRAVEEAMAEETA